MSKPAAQWTESDLIALIGQPESFRLEFKSARMFDPESQGRLADTLSKAVSAFANSEGGTIVIGMAERKEGKETVGDHLDGVDENTMSLPRLQQIVESSVSPRLQGIRFRAIRFGDQQRTCFVISVPEGSTAHQARDLKYYGRSEFESKALADHEIRMRMEKGRIKRAGLEVRRWLSGGFYKPAYGEVMRDTVDVPFGEAESHERSPQSRKRSARSLNI